MFEEFSPPLMSTVFVDDAASLALAVPAVECGLILHLRMLSPSVLRAEAQRRGLGQARSDDSPQRIEYFSGGRLQPRGAHQPQVVTPRSSSDLPAQVLPVDLVSPLKHRVVSSPGAWQSRTRPSGHSSSLEPFFSYATRRLSSHHELTLASDLNFSPLHCPRFLFHPKPLPIVLVAPYYFTNRRISVDMTAR
jgi:hypothetical protein